MKNNPNPIGRNRWNLWWGTRTELEINEKQKSSRFRRFKFWVLHTRGPVLSNRLLKLINKCWREISIPEEWGQATVKSLFKKGKCDDCSNYRGISLLNSGYKIYAKIITQHLKTISEAILLEEQNGFRRGRSCIDKVFTLKQTIEKKREFNLKTHIAFLD